MSSKRYVLDVGSAIRTRWISERYLYIHDSNKLSIMIILIMTLDISDTRYHVIQNDKWQHAIQIAGIIDTCWIWSLWKYDDIINS